jgi:hypothetical protein
MVRDSDGSLCNRENQEIFGVAPSEKGHEAHGNRI